VKRDEKTQIVTLLHHMVEEIAKLPDELWDDVFPTFRITLRRKDDDTAIMLVVSIEEGSDEP
jgi:hypothetical protein